MDASLFLGETSPDAAGNWSVTVDGPLEGQPLVVAWDRSATLATAWDSPHPWSWDPEQWESPNLEFRLEAGGQISGRLTDPAGAPVPEGKYALVQGDDTFSARYPVLTLDVDPQTGQFTSPAVAPGEYRIAHDSLDGGYLANNDAARVQAIAGQTASAGTIQLQLTQAGTISGHVADKSGLSLSGARIQGYISSQGSYWPSYSPFSVNGSQSFWTTTGEDGTYTADNLIPHDSWNVEFYIPVPRPYAALSTGLLHSCAIAADQTIDCWGSDNDGESDPPDGQFTAVAAGGGYSCGLRTGGAIECWGRLDLIETDHPGPGSSLNHTPTTPVSTRAVTVEMPLRVYVAGDSQTPFLGSWLNTDNRLDVTVDARHSTGLARPDVYDWTSRFADVLAHQDPELVVLVIGGNDPQAMWNADGTAAAPYLASGWRHEYNRRINSVLDQFAAPHRHLVWVGQPPARPDHFHEGYAVLNQIAAEAIAARSDTTFLDIWDLFGGEHPYRSDIAPPGGGEPIAVRHSDGVHLNLTGSRWVAELVLDVVSAQWELAQN